MQCQKCGKDNDEQSRFCQDCGFMLSSPGPGGDGKRISKGFFITSLAAGIGISNFLIKAASVLGDSDSARVYYYVPAVMLGLFSLVVLLNLVYKMWKAIQDGHARTTPGAAVGYLFIPLFNIGWIFVALWGFAVDYNRYLSRHSLQNELLPQRLFLAYPILTLSMAFAQFELTRYPLPDIHLALSLAGLVVLLMMVSRICDAVNTLPRVELSTLEV